MSFVQWIYKNVRIPKDSFVEMLDRIDADNDGYITIGEIVRAIKAHME